MLPRFKHSLVPVDLTHKNKSALELGFEAGGTLNDKVSVARACPTPLVK